MLTLQETISYQPPFSFLPIQRGKVLVTIPTPSDTVFQQAVETISNSTFQYTHTASAFILLRDKRLRPTPTKMNKLVSHQDTRKPGGIFLTRQAPHTIITPPQALRGCTTSHSAYLVSERKLSSPHVLINQLQV